MKPAIRVAFLLPLLSCTAAWSAPAQEAQPDFLTRGAYLSFMLGNGRVSDDIGGDRGMRWRAGEIRFGKTLVSGAGRSGLRMDVLYANDGHPHNNHRDGFGLQLLLTQPVAGKVVAEAGLGPYLSMNTTTRAGGREVNDSRTGALLSLALRIGTGGAGDEQGVHMRIGLNHVRMPGAHSSTALLLGVGRQFGDPPVRTDRLAGRPTWIGAAIGSAVTNHSDTDRATLYSLEARRYWESSALSLSAIREGDDGVRVNRSGVAAQGWFVQPLNENWAVSAGAGPYIAKNQRDDGGLRLHALLSLQAERKLGQATRFFVSFSRVKTFQEENDRDLARIGLLHAFGSR